MIESICRREIQQAPPVRYSSERAYTGLWDGTELPEKTEQIKLGPLFRDFIVSYSIDENSRIDNFLVCRRSPEKGSCVGPLKAVTRAHLVALGKLIINGELHIWKSRAQGLDELSILHCYTDSYRLKTASRKSTAVSSAVGSFQWRVAIRASSIPLQSTRNAMFGSVPAVRRAGIQLAMIATASSRPETVL